MTTPVGATAPPADTTPPTVSLTAPPAGPVSGTVNVAATASDNVGVSGVQFRLDGAAIGAEDTSAPYSVSWDTTAATAGTHTLTAVARDAAGNRHDVGAGERDRRRQRRRAAGAPVFVNDRVIIGLDEPTQIAWTPDGRMLIAERDGTIWVVPPGSSQVLPTPLIQVPSVQTADERGLLGLTHRPAVRAERLHLRLLHARHDAQPRLALHRDRQHGVDRERARGLAEPGRGRDLAPGR